MYEDFAQIVAIVLEERGVLYRLLAERIWNPHDLLQEVNT